MQGIPLAATAALFSCTRVAIGRASIAAAMLVVAGCGGGGSGSQSPPPPPPPAAATVASIAPASVVAGSGAFTLTVDGTGFVSGAVVSVDGSAVTTAFVSATRLTAAMPATAASLPVQVTNPGTAASNLMNLAVTTPIAPLAITSLSPATLAAGSAAFTLTVNGTGFTSSSRVSFGGSVVATTVVSSTQLTAAAPALGVVATLPVLVVDGAASSSAVNFDVTADTFPAVLSVTLGSSTFGGNRDSTVASADAQGRFVAFQSAATDLVAGDLGDGRFSGIYLRDTCVGAAPACVPTTRLASLNAAGTQCARAGASLGSFNPAISADGRFVAFGTDTCFAAAPANVRQIALRDTCVTASGPVTGCTAATTLVSANTSGQASASNLSAIPAPAISRNGRYVAWTSVASDLVTGVASGGFLQTYLRDRCETSAGPVAGCTPQTLLVSGIVGAAANYDASQSFIAVSDNGIVVFDTGASNLVANPDLFPGSLGGVFRADCSGGASLCALSIVTLVPGSGTSGSAKLVTGERPAISPDGRFIAFLSQGGDAAGHLATTLPPNLPPANLQLPGKQVMRYDSCISGSGSVPTCTPTFSYESVLDNGNLDLTLAAQASEQPSFSDDGRYLSFTVPYNLSSLYPGAGHSVYVRDTCAGAPAGCMPHSALVSVDRTQVAAGNVGWSRISGDGHFVVFYSLSRSPANTSNLLPIGQVIMVRTGF